MPQRSLRAGTAFDLLPLKARVGLQQLAHVRVRYFDFRGAHGASGDLIGIEEEDERFVTNAVIVIQLEPITSGSLQDIA